MANRTKATELSEKREDEQLEEFDPLNTLSIEMKEFQTAIRASLEERCGQIK